MENLLSLFLFAAAFYFVMRFGFGIGVHSGSDEESIHIEDQKNNIDPVCGMEVDVTKGYRKMYEGNSYRFCSRGCLDKFDIEPK